MQSQGYGGAIKGNKIDIFVPNRQDALAWGVGPLKLCVLTLE